MKRFTLKRITAFALALIMTLSLCPITAWAAEEAYTAVLEGPSIISSIDDGIDLHLAVSGNNITAITGTLEYDAEVLEYSDYYCSLDGWSFSVSGDTFTMSGLGNPINTETYVVHLYFGFKEAVSAGKEFSVSLNDVVLYAGDSANNVGTASWSDTVDAAYLYGPRNVTPGSEVTLTFNVPVSNLASAEATLEYDSSVLEYVSYESLQSEWTLSFNESYMSFSMWGDPLDADAELLSVTFRVKDDISAETTLNVTFTEVLGWNFDREFYLEDASWSGTVTSASLSGSSAVGIGETVTLTQTVTGSNITGLETTLDYDATLLELVSYESIHDGWIAERDGAKFMLTGTGNPIDATADEIGIFAATFRVKDTVTDKTALHVSFTDTTLADDGIGCSVNDTVWNAVARNFEAQWGTATGTNNTGTPTSWTSGTLTEAMTYANGLPSGTAYIQLLKNVNTTEPLVFNSGKTTILDLNGHDIDRGLTARVDGGNVVTVNGTLTLCDTSTTEVSNQGKITGGYTWGEGGGVFINSGTFTMQSGAISGNSAGFGGGVSTYGGGTFTLNGGVISGNSAIEEGGGVYANYDSTFTMRGGTISGNSSTCEGGGVSSSNDFLMTAGTITENTAVEHGGGVFVWSGFTMSGGTISENKAEYGGGVYISGSVTGDPITLKGGAITGNTAEYGGGVYLFDLYGFTTLAVSGAPVITGNTVGTVANNFYLPSGKTITVGTLNSGANIGITMADGSGTFTSGGSSYANKGYFASDAAGYVVVADGSNLKLAEQLSISFNANGGSGTMENQDITSGVATALNANTFTRDNYYFSGWNTKTDGTGTAYADKATITVTEGTMLYAQWEVAEARWGLASGTNSDEMPASWTNGPLADAITYANSLTSGTAYIQLLNNVDTTAALTFASDKTTILDLNGHDIDRGLAEATNNGNVITVYGNLTMCDTSTNVVLDQGKITGGYKCGPDYGKSALDGGGGVLVYGNFTMNSGNIMGNSAECGGGGVCVQVGGSFTMNEGSISENIATHSMIGNGGGILVHGGTFNMTGGTIFENTAQNGGGVYLTPGYQSVGGEQVNGSFTMGGGIIQENSASSGGGVYINYSDEVEMSISGSPIVKNNLCNGNPSNVNGRITVGTLSSGANIGITGSAGYVFTRGGADYINSGYFISDDPELVISRYGSDLKLFAQKTISFNANGGNGTMDPQVVKADYSTALNKNTFVRTDYVFTGWNTSADGTGTAYANRQSITVQKDTTLYAQWDAVQVQWGEVTETGMPSHWETDILSFAVDSANAFSNETTIYIRLIDDVITTATLEFNKTTILDLNGHDINRNLNEATENGNVITVNGNLTLCDTSQTAATTPGKITGGYNSGNGGGVLVNRNGIFAMNGGEISGNTASNGGGVYIPGGASMSVSGAPRISENTDGTGLNNVFLHRDEKITVGTLTLGANIGVSMQDVCGTFTVGGATYVEDGYFTCDNSTCTVAVAGVDLQMLTSLGVVRWGMASNSSAPAIWTGSGTMAEAMTYANGLTSGTAYIQLLSNVKTTSALSFIHGKTTILDLNGHDIDRGLTEETENGCVIIVVGNLTLCDTSSTELEEQGKITGGYNSSGGGVCVGRFPGTYATFTMNGGTISGNNAEVMGGGVYVPWSDNTFIMNGGTISGNAADRGGGVCTNGGTFEMNGGTISGNYANYGGGVCGSFTMKDGFITGNNAVVKGGGGFLYNSGGFIKLSGKPFIFENTKGGILDSKTGRYVLGETGIADNLRLSYYDCITIDGALGEGAAIGIGQNISENSYEKMFTAAVGNDYTLTESDFSKFSGDDMCVLFLDISKNEVQLARRAFLRGSKEIGINQEGTIALCVAEENLTKITATLDYDDTVLEILSCECIAPGWRLERTGSKITLHGEKNPIQSVVDVLSITFRVKAETVISTTFSVSLKDITFSSANNTFNVRDVFWTGSAVAPQQARWAYLSECNGDQLPTVWHQGGTFEEAMMNGSYIQLLEDIEINDVLTFTGNKVLNLNGKDIERVLPSATEDGHVIEVTGNLTITDTSANAAINPGKITGGYSTIKAGGIYVNGGSLTLNGGAITGNIVVAKDSHGAGGGVYVEDGKFTMNGGFIRINEINGKDDEFTFGGGVYVRGDSTFTMNGGTISHNRLNGGGAVGGGVFSNGSCTMSGGTISSNEALLGSGVVVSEDKFTMSGGTISENTAEHGGGLAVLEGGTFTMTDGTISGNTASDSGGGVLVLSGIFEMNGGTISNNTAETANGGGVLSNGTFTMNGGTISGNTAAVFGGGVWGRITMHGGTISGNTADDGGGVYVYGGTFKMTAGTIANNTAEMFGGGVEVAEHTFEMDNGTVSGNTAKYDGGGVYVSGDGFFTMNNGTISGNTAESCGGGVYVSSGPFTMIGGTISGNNATNGGGISGYNIKISGGTITGNNASRVLDDYGNYRGGCGGGIYGEYGSTNIQLWGKPVITGNLYDGTLNSKTGLYENGVESNVWLASESVISVVDALKDGASIGISASLSYNETSRVVVTGIDTAPAYTLPADDAAKFTSDNEMVLEYKSANNSLILKNPPEPTADPRLEVTSGSLNLFEDSTLIVPVDWDYTITSVEFVDWQTRNAFNITMLGNDRLEIIPKTDKPEYMTWAEWSESMVGTYKSAIRFEYITGTTYTSTNTLSITLTATAPAVTAAAVKFNSFLAGDTQELVFTTSETITGVALDTSMENPEWIIPNDDGTVTLINEKLTKNKGSGKLNLLVEMEGWRVPAEVAVSVSAAYTAPKLKLKTSSVNLVSKAQYQEPVELALLSGDKSFDINKVTDLNVDNDAYIVEYLGGGIFTLDTVEDITGGKVNLIAEIDGKPNQTVTVPLTVKVVMPALKANPAKVTLNTAKGYAEDERDEMTVTFSGDVPEFWYNDVTWEITPPKNATADMLTVENNNDGTLTFYANEGIVDGSYKVNVTVGAAKPVAITVTAKATLPKLKLDKSSVTLNTAMGDNADVQMVTVTDNDVNYDFVLLQEEITSPNGISAVVDENNTIAVSALSETANGSYKVEIDHKMPGGQSVKSTLTVKVAAKLPTLKPDNKTLSLDMTHGIGTVNVDGLAGFGVGELVVDPTVDGITVDMIDRDSFTVKIDETLDKKGGKINVSFKLSDSVATKPVAITVKPVTAVTVTAAVKGNMDVTRPESTSTNFTFKYTGWYPGEYGDMAYEPTLVWEVYAMNGKNKIVGYEEYDFVTGKGSLVASSDDNNGGWYCDISDGDYDVSLALNTDENSAWKTGEINPKYTYNAYVKLVFADGTEVACKPVKMTVKQGSAKFAADTKTVTVAKQQGAESVAFAIYGTDKDKQNVAEIAKVEVAASKNPSAFTVVESGDGYAVKVVDPSIAKNGTVKLNIWLEGNYVDGCEDILNTKDPGYRKPNATVSLKVTVQ